MVMSDFRPEVETWPFYACAVKNTQYNPYLVAESPKFPRRVSVRLSACPSDTNRHCTQMAKHRITQTTPYDSPWTLDFSLRRSRRNSNRVALTGRHIQVG